MQSSIAGETEVARTGCGCVAVLGFRELAKAESTSGRNLQMTRMKYPGMCSLGGVHFDERGGGHVKNAMCMWASGVHVRTRQCARGRGCVHVYEAVCMCTRRCAYG